MFKKIKSEVLYYVRHRPKLRLFLSKIYFLFLKLRIHRKIRFKKITFVNPKDIRYFTRKFNPFCSAGVIKAGDWDIDRIDIQILPTFKGLRERFIEKKKWEDTIYFKKNIERINSGEILWHCRDEKDFRERCKGIDKLFQDIKNRGFHLESEKGKDKAIRDYDFVSVNVGRSGDLIFNDGAHRLVIAQILKLDKIPVRVLVRHKTWYNLIKKIMSLIPAEGAYQSFNHPDLDNNFKVIHTSEDRFKLIKDNIKIKKHRKLLDIGANMGYFSMKFEELNYNCYLLEHEINFINYLEEVKRVRGYKYNVVSGDMFEWPALRKVKFDVVLALNIFHHYLKTKEFYEKLKIFLNKLNTDVLVLETHNIKESQMKGAYKNYTPKEFVNFVLKEAELKHVSRIGKVKGGRELFIISK